MLLLEYFMKSRSRPWAFQMVSESRNLWQSEVLTLGTSPRWRLCSSLCQCLPGSSETGPTPLSCLSLCLGQRGAGGYSHRSFCHQQEVSTKATHCPHPLPSFSEGAFCLLHTKLSLLISIINTAFASPTRSSLLWVSLHPCWSCGPWWQPSLQRILEERS